MANQGENNIKLGAFVLTGLLALIFTLYMIGQNRSLFGSNFELRARFTNVNGLIEGNNVQFSGIQAGTVKSITVLDDTTIEAVMLIDNKFKSFIRKNSRASIGTQGLMGDKVINITPAKAPGPLVAEHDLIGTRKALSTDEMLETLSKTNINIADISDALKATVNRLNTSQVWDLIDDRQLRSNIKSTLSNIRQTSVNAKAMTQSLNEIISDTKQGKGSVGMLLKDTALAVDLHEAVVKVKSAGDNANQVIGQLNQAVNELNNDLHQGKGAVRLLLNDSVTARNLSLSMKNIESGTNRFNQIMEALKHNFLVRGYFKNQEKQRSKQADTTRKK